MIPKIIHYCWFGGADKPKLAQKCIKSWKKYCKDYQIIEWNESNYDISSAPLYVRQAYEAKKWAFVTDYVRLQVVYENGGIYFDTDVEVLKPFDDLLEHSAFFGFESSQYIATGLGFGAEKGHPLLKLLMNDYNDIPFILDDGTFDQTPCPVRNSRIFKEYGFVLNGELQTIEGVSAFPKSVFNPKSGYGYHVKKTTNTMSIHHFSASWADQKEKANWKKSANEYHREKLFQPCKSLLKKVLGEENFNRIKKLRNMSK